MKRRLIGISLLALMIAGAALAAEPAHRSQATAAAHRLMAKVRLPPGASATRSDPSEGALERPPSRPASPDLVDLHAFWQLPGDPHSAYQWIEQHPPAGSKQTMTGTSGSASGPSEWSVGFSFGRSGTETLLISVAAARGGGSAVRADAQVLWLRKRSRSERIPAGIHVVTVSSKRFGAREGPYTVTAAAKVRRIVRLVDRLPLAPPGVFACPVDQGPHVTIDFRRAPGAKPVASATADGSGCGEVSLTIRGRAEPPLADGPDLIHRLQALVGRSLNPSG